MRPRNIPEKMTMKTPPMFQAEIPSASASAASQVLKNNVDNLEDTFLLQF